MHPGKIKENLFFLFVEGKQGKEGHVMGPMGENCGFECLRGMRFEKHIPFLQSSLNQL